MKVRMRGVQTRVIFKPLRGLLGEAAPGVIRINPKQAGKVLMDTLIHEAIHACEPDMDECDVRANARDITRLLWKLNYRRVDNGS